MDTIKIRNTNKNFIDLLDGHFAVMELKGKNFAKSISENMEILKKELEELEVLGRPSPEFLELAQEVNSLNDKDVEETKELVTKLEEENKELIEERQKQVEVMNDKLQENITIELNTLIDDIIPEDISAKQLTQIKMIIVDKK